MLVIRAHFRNAPLGERDLQPNPRFHHQHLVVALVKQPMLQIDLARGTSVGILYYRLSLTVTLTESDDRHQLCQITQHGILLQAL
jgi:hypothetical protein